MAEYTRKDIICFGDDPRSKNVIGKKVYASNNLTDLIALAKYGNPDLWCETLAIVNKDADSHPFVTKVEGVGYKYYDAIIIKKEEER